MPLFGKKKDSDDPKLNLDNLSLENDDDDDDNDDWDDDDDDDDDEEDNILKEALGGLDDDDDDDDEKAKDSEDDEELDSDLLDIFTNEEETDVDLAALTEGLEDIEASSLLTQAQQIAATFRSLTQPNRT